MLWPILLLQLAQKLQAPEAAVGSILIAWYHFTNSARFVQRHLLPQLALTLSPLRPSQNEIETVLHELKQQGFRIGKKIKVPALMQALHNAQPHSGNVASPPQATLR